MVKDFFVTGLICRWHSGSGETYVSFHLIQECWIFFPCSCISFIIIKSIIPGTWEYQPPALSSHLHAWECPALRAKAKPGHKLPGGATARNPRRSTSDALLPGLGWWGSLSDQIRGYIWEPMQEDSFPWSLTKPWLEGKHSRDRLVPGPDPLRVVPAPCIVSIPCTLCC